MPAAVKMDSRKFLSQLNDSAQAKVAIFEDRIAQMGRQGGKVWKLAALHDKELYIEDVSNHTYYVADHARDHGKVSISNIRPLQIVEGEKKELFEETAFKLITALESNDQKAMASAFDRLKAQRFSSRAVPHSGMVRCRDGVLRFIPIANGDNLSEDVRDRLISAIVESLRDNVIVENGHVTAGYFGDEQVKLPVTKWATRKLVARRMREAAKDAYWSEGFQTRVAGLAKLVAEGKLEEAVKSVSTFLEEMEEFTLLTRAQTQTLIENALAAKIQFNQQLCTDTATLFHRTNLKINKAKIVEEWRNIAKKAEHPVLAENVHILENSKNFEASHDKFLTLIFEAISNREVAAEALATTLDVLRGKTPKIRESHELSSKLNGLITRLKQHDFDDAAIYEAEDLIATIQEELAATETLGDFDQLPGDTAGMNQGAAATAPSGQGGAPVININSPLIQIGGSSAAGGPDAAGAGAMGDPAAAGGGDPELEALLGAGGGAGVGAAGAGGAGAGAMGGAGAGGAGAGAMGGAGAGGMGGGQPLMQSTDRNGNVLAEDDSDDPYAIRPNEQIVSEGLRFTDYGAPVITDEGDLDKIIKVMRRLATEHKLVGKALQENLEDMARASIRAIGLRIPSVKLAKAVEEAVGAFAEEWEKPWLKKKDKDEEGDDGDEDGDDEGVAEDQYKYPWRKPRGRDKSNYRNVTPKKTTNESITWGQSQSDAILGEMAGVRFIFDHGADSNLAPAILSEDGAVEIPIPQELCEDAFAAANMTDNIDCDGSRFTAWLSESIEQLRPLTDAENSAIEEAVAKITAGADGTLSVEVTPDVGVSQVDDGGEEMGGSSGMDDDMSGGGMDDGMGGGDEMTNDGMAPVDSIEPQPTQGQADPGAAMPDFEGGQDTMEEPQAQPQGQPAKPQPTQPKPQPTQGQPQEDDGVHFEDKDITEPNSAGYTKHVKDNKRAMPAVKIPGKTNDKLDSIGPELKTDDGSGVNPPTAKKGSNE